MFIPIHQLTRFSISDKREAEERWQTADGRITFERVIELIRDGAGEDFLQSDFERGRLPILKNMWDLRGIQMAAENLVFAREENFEAIDFSYAHIAHCSFEGAAFSCNFSYVVLSNCNFRRCVFAYNGFYGAVLNNCTFHECDFWDGNRITNTEFKSVKLDRCLIPENIFFDCRFDQATIIRGLQDTPVIMTSSNVKAEKSQLAALYFGIKEAYAAGNCIGLARQYHYMARQSATRYNAGNWRVKLSGLLLEWLTGYGVKPLRVLMAMAIVFSASLAWFAPQVGLNDALMLVSGAMFTFGAFSELIRPLDTLSRIVYILTAFVGVCGTALFVTVWAVKWLRE